MKKEIVSGLQIHTARRKSCRISGAERKALCRLCIFVIFAAAAFLLFRPEAKDGLKVLCNRLFEASESVNAYIYVYFEVAEGTSAAKAVVLLSVILAALCVLAVLCKSRLIPALLAASLAAVQIWFGLALPSWLNVCLFAVFGLALSEGRRDIRLCFPYAGCVLAAALLVSCLFPGIHPATENASEAVRDRLDDAEQQLYQRVTNTFSETRKTRHENRLDLEAAGTEEDTFSSDREYRYEQTQESVISRPEQTDYLKMILLLLLVIVLLLAPFLPFLLVDQRRKRALEHRAQFDAEDHAAAIRAMFLHVAACLERCGKSGGNRPFSAWAEPLALCMPENLCARYREAAALWQEAAYSSHSMTEQQRNEMRRILEELEGFLYDQADRKTRFRMKYLDCLFQ
ncbi:MAG: hypothetical protein ACI3XT_01795 [Butyricicoccaceae bacterium]